MSDPFAEAALLMADSRYALGREYSAPRGVHPLGRLYLPRAVLHDHGGDASHIALRCRRCGIIDALPLASLEPSLRALLESARTEDVG